MSGFAPQKYEHFALFDEVFEKLGEGFPCVSYSRFDCLRMRVLDFQIILKPCGFGECSTNDQIKYPDIGDRLPATLSLLTPMGLVTTRDSSADFSIQYPIFIGDNEPLNLTS